MSGVQCDTWVEGDLIGVEMYLKQPVLGTGPYILGRQLHRQQGWCCRRSERTCAAMRLLLPLCHCTSGC